MEGEGEGNVDQRWLTSTVTEGVNSSFFLIKLRRHAFVCCLVSRCGAVHQ